MVKFTLWLFNIAMERSTICKFGKPSISMGHTVASMAILNNQMVINKEYISHT
jgi:hypothetical protein